ncbi:MAG: type II toxin-antitoxin system RelE/ParE family toxin [Deltaproteobacteria bacterium]|nr:type II toxin-antitoxin system RelE/ParE family toxin [Deltaproteobacteria bacterium]
MIRFRPDAVADLQAAFAWYEGREAGVGEQLIAAVDGVVARIDRNPRAFPKTYGEFRRAVVTRFPYCVYFVVEHSACVVVGVLHGRQDLRRLLGRNA